ncbi:MAG TPA: lysophospholipid acyltransferase family protein [Candidatus Didemnitutus sp.]|nr:lysophospholipid acyltransferase family protein [Candidatus Didemnitutus sp.]
MVTFAHHLLGYYFTLLLFAAGGLGLNLFGLIAAPFCRAGRAERFFQRIIHRLFRFFVWWMGFIRLCFVRYHGLERLPRDRAFLLAANHPGLMDITYLLARIPEAICVFKPAIRRNPVLGAGARRAGYLVGAGGHDLVRQAAEKLAAGNVLVIFPEGTRTLPGTALQPLRPGFVLMARRGGVPVQLVRITWDSNVLVKGRAWWKVPRLPAHVDVTVGPLIPVPPDADTEAVAAGIADWFRSPAPAGDAACMAAPGALSSTPRLSPAP